MKQKVNRMYKNVNLSLLMATLLTASLPLAAQTPIPRQRALISQPANDRQLVTLSGNTHPLARRPEFDRGAAPPDLPMQRMMLVLKRSAEQEAALARLMAEQQDSSSPNYHRWLTPVEFGERFGPAPQDIKAITDWLELHGFQVNEISNGRTYIEFSGNAAQVEGAFHTSIHGFEVERAQHWANVSDPQIPAALAPVVAGVATLHNFLSKPQLVISKQKRTARFRSGVDRPHFTDGFGDYSLAPADYATIYNIKPLYNAGINGNGVNIAVLGRSNINLQDVASFRQVFNLPNNNPQLVINGPDPGNLGGGEEGEAVLDTTWAGAVAPNATVKFVISASTNSADGVDLSEAYAVNHNVGAVMTESFGSCEANYTQAQATSISNLAQQAAAEGITYTVSTGDNGSDGCDDPNSVYSATQPVSVNILASTPYNVAVGGTQFDDTNGGGPFWDASSGNALSYIPEDVWNENCNENSCFDNFSLWAGSGGVSMYFPKPSWQTGVTGIPNDTHRHLPDVSLTAAIHDPYLLCIDGSCTPDIFGNVNFAQIGGTSAAAPSFAGIMALVVQKTGSRQGQADAVLYRLASTANFAQCNGSNLTPLPSSGCIFNDVTVGTNAVPGEPNFGGPGETYDATTGYDMATGLGSVNAYNLVTKWSGGGGGSGSPAVTFSPTSISFGSVPVGASKAANIKLTNSGSAMLTISGLSITGSNQSSFSETNNCGGSLGAGANCTITATFRPQSTGSLSAALTVSDNAAGSPQSVGLSGSGTSCTYSLSATSQTFSTAAATGSVAVNTQAGCGWNASSNAGSWLQITSGASGTGSGTVTYNVPANTGAAARIGTLSIAGKTDTVTQAGTATGTPSALRFIPITPCRVADTRTANGPFGGPVLAAGATRQFVVPSSSCGVPTSAQAYSMNVTVVPAEPLDALTVWPSGQPEPNVSTLNSLDGRIKANAAIIPAGTSGGVNVAVTDRTHVILDINGYFVPASNSSALQFYPVTPCRIADTRYGSGPLAGPFLRSGSTRAFPVLASSCRLPADAKAYSLNLTAVPREPINYLTAWPTGAPEPTASTLNAPTGTVTANASIVEAGTSGNVSMYTTGNTDLIIDVNGYFAPPASGGLSLYALTPCRALDSRNPTGSNPFTGTRAVSISNGGCGAPPTAHAYVLNATVVPPGALDYLTLWATGQTEPNVSTLNAFDGAISSNMAIVPAVNGSVDAYASNATQLILDLAGYFAP